MGQKRSAMWKAGMLRHKPHLAFVNVGSAFRWRCTVKGMPCIGHGKTPEEAFTAWRADATYWGKKYLTQQYCTPHTLWTGKELLRFAGAA